MSDVETEFRKIFGDMYLSDSETALRVFEHGYKAGVAAENEACAKVCDEIDAEYDGEDVLASWCAEAIRARIKS